MGLSAPLAAYKPSGTGKELKAKGFGTDEHVALTFNLTKNEQTKAVTIHYSEPDECTLSISADVTVNADGSVVKSSEPKFFDKKTGKYL